MAHASDNYGRRIARMFAMSDAVWERHANPWSVWTRVASLPLLLAAIWSHVWLGWVAAVLLATLVAAWLWLNPRVFPPPRSTASWAARVTLGERVWLNRAATPVPKHHAVMAHLLAAVGGAGFALAVYGAFFAEIWPTLLGTAVAYLSKLWFCDRMVWLYEDMKGRDPSYRSWLR
jgi:Family of unknown function (DUF6653)